MKKANDYFGEKLRSVKEVQKSAKEFRILRLRIATLGRENETFSGF